MTLLFVSGGLLPEGAEEAGLSGFNLLEDGATELQAAGMTLNLGGVVQTVAGRLNQAINLAGLQYVKLLNNLIAQKVKNLKIMFYLFGLFIPISCPLLMTFFILSQLIISGTVMNRLFFSNLYINLNIVAVWLVCWVKQ